MFSVGCPVSSRTFDTGTLHCDAFAAPEGATISIDDLIRFAVGGHGRAGNAAAGSERPFAFRVTFDFLRCASDRFFFNEAELVGLPMAALRRIRRLSSLPASSERFV